ncbi:MAG TPA: helix-turn-helix domain-containing protein [Candidatus Dormibacteraeota bacterium]|nr:helix-turn-helix domain-containing protein [Candidatus Dormibacteraeota bacterium]
MTTPAAALQLETLATRKEARFELRRRRLLEAALGLFAERGYEETSVGAIVARARMSKSAFYEHFNTKEHCFREVLLAEGGQLIRDVLASGASGRDHHERLRLGITRFVVACFERSTVARLLIVESVGLSAAVDDVRHELQGQFAAAVAEEVRHAMPHDAFYADKDPVVFGRAVVGAVNDAVSYFLTHPGADADSLAASLCRIFAP